MGPNTCQNRPKPTLTLSFIMRSMFKSLLVRFVCAKNYGNRMKTDFAMRLPMSK